MPANAFSAALSTYGVRTLAVDNMHFPVPESVRKLCLDGSIARNAVLNSGERVTALSLSTMHLLLGVRRDRTGRPAPLADQQWPLFYDLVELHIDETSRPYSPMQVTLMAGIVLMNAEETLQCLSIYSPGVITELTALIISGLPLMEFPRAALRIDGTVTSTQMMQLLPSMNKFEVVMLPRYAMTARDYAWLDSHKNDVKCEIWFQDGMWPDVTGFYHRKFWTNRVIMAPAAASATGVVRGVLRE